METHTPYYSPDGGNPINVTIGDAFAGQVKNPERIQAGYRKSVEVLAKEYKKLYTILKDDFDYVITVGDHGEMLGEDKMWNHGYGLYPELVRIPLVISGNDIPDSEHNGLVSILDIHKTIGDLAGVELNSRGNNLIDSPSERPLITEYHGFLPWHRDQFERKGVPDRVYDEHDTELYGIVSRHGYAYDTHSDGFCTDDYIDLTEAKKQVREIRNGINEREVETFDTQIDESTKQQLRELGYA